MAECRSCHAPMQWGTERETAGKIPLDVTPVQIDTPGARVVVPARGSRGPILWCYSLGDLAAAIAAREDVPISEAYLLVADRYDAYLSHFSTCPDAAQHRRM